MAEPSFAITSNVIQSGTEAADTIYVGTSNYPVNDVTVRAGLGNDSVRNQNGTRTYIDAGAGNDRIDLNNGSFGSTINTGSGNDTIRIFSTDTTHIIAGAGSADIKICADTGIVVRAEGESYEPATFSFDYYNAASIQGAATMIGAGNGVLTGTKNSDLFIGESGANTIVNYSGEDTVRFAVNRSYVSGDDVVLIDAVGNKLTVKNAKGHVLKVQSSAYSQVQNSVYGGEYSTSPNDVIKTFMNSLNNTSLSGTSALNEAVSAASNGRYSTMSALISAATLDCKNYGSDTFLKDCCGIVLDNADTGAITGWDAGGEKIKTAESIVPESGSLINFSGDSFGPIEGLTVKLEKSFYSLTTAQQKIVRGLYSWWTENALELIKDSYGDEFSFAEGNVKSSAKTITLKFANGGSYLAQVTSSDEDGDTSGDLMLTINMSYYNSIDMNDPNGSGNYETAGYLDRTLAHEFTHAIMAATINDFHKLPSYIKEGMAELTHGIDDTRGSDIKALASNSTTLSRALVDSTTPLGAFYNVDNPSYAGGYILLRYLAKQSAIFDANSDEYDDTDADADADVDSDVDDERDGEYNYIANYISDIALNGTDDDDMIYNYASRVTVNAGDGDDTISLNGARNVLEYNVGDDDDIVFGFDDDDTLQLADDAAYTTLNFGSDLIVSLGSGSITLKDAADRSITIRGGARVSDYINNTTQNTLITGTSSADSIYNYAYYVTIDGGAGDDSINNAAGDYVSIDGGTGNDSIFNGNLNWNNTIHGGLGDDTITNEGNYGIYQYARGDGNDVIFGFGYDDTLQLTDGANYTTLKSGSDLIVSLGSGSITLKDAADRSINIDGGSSLTGGNDTIPSGNVISVSEDSPSIDNSRADISIIGSEEDDSIVNSGARVSIVEREGENTIRNTGAFSTILGGEDDDLIINSGASVSINGGEGDDTLSTSVNSTLTGGDGDDFFRIGLADSSSRISINITDFNEDDALSFLSSNTTGFIYSIGGGNMTLTDNTGAIALTLGGVTSFDEISDIEVDLRDYVGNRRLTTTLGNIATLASSGSVSLEGVKLNSSGKTLKIKDPFAGKIRAADFGDKIKTINAASDKNAVELIGNELNNVIKASKGGSTIEGGGGKDKITCGKGADLIIYSDGDGKDVIKKFDATQDKIQIENGAIDSVKIKGKHVVLNVGDGSLTVQKAVGQELTIIDADGIESTYVFTKQNSDLDSARVSSNAQLFSSDDEFFDDDEFSNFDVRGILLGTANDDTLQNYAGGSSIFGSLGNDLIISSTLEDFLIARQHFGYVTIDGGDGNDTIESHDPYVSINGGTGNDLIKTNGWDHVTMRGGAGDDTLIGSANKSEVYQFAEGDGIAFIIGFDSSDTLEFLDDAAYETLNTGNALLVSIGNSDNTIMPEGVKLNSSGKTLKIKTPFTGTIDAADYGDKVKTINAASDKNAVELIGNELNNVIKASKGGSTIEGGGGNDKITCGKGNDLIVYSDGDGKDVIKKFDAKQDKIQIENGAIDSVKIKGKHVVLNVGDGSLTVQKAVGQEMKIVDADGIESTYVFTKQNSDLNSARVSSNAQLPSEDYWFEQDSAIEDPINEIMSEDAAIDLHFDQLREVLESSSMFQSITQSNEGAQRHCKNHG